MSVATASYWSGSIINSATSSYVENAQSASYVQNAQTASYVVQAQSASYWSGSIINSATASYVENAQSASYVLNAQSASYWSGSITNAATASYVVTAQTASYVLNAVSASFALTASYISGSGGGVGFPFSGSAIITGSLFVSGSTISGSFVGDGSGITGLTAGGKIHTQTSEASTWTVTHNLGVQYPNVTVYNSSNEIIIPQTITATDANTLTLTFGSAVAGYAVAGIGGIINVQGRTTQQYFTASTTWSFAHNLGDKYVSLQAFDDAFEMMIPTTIRLVDFTSSLLLFDSASSGYAVATIGGDLPAISSSYAGYTLQVASSAPYSASWVAVPNVTVTTAQTASYANNFTVGGTLTAQTINVQTITSSIEFVTGSTRNGSLAANTHQFTGSVLMSGSLNVGGASTFSSGITSNSTLATYLTNGTVLLRDNGASQVEVNIRHTNSRNGVISFTQDGVADRWAIGTKPSDGTLYFSSNFDLSSPKVVITSTGNVGIGTTSPQRQFVISNGGAEGLEISAGSGRTTIISYNRSTSAWLPLVLTEGTSNVLIGTTSDNGYKLRVSGGIYAGNLYLQQSQASGGGTLTLANNDPSPDSGTVIGQVNFYNTDADIPGVAAYMRAYTGASFGVGGQLGFGTQNTWSSGTLNQRMFIDNAGNIGAPSGTNIYNASDRRLKRNISSIENGLSKVMALNPVKFNWIEKFVESEENKDMLGFIAQELLPHIPEAVESFGESDLHINGIIIENPLRVNEKFIIPVLVKAIQELSAKNTALEERLTALENK
jgi:hypothetical protein